MSKGSEVGSGQDKKLNIADCQLRTETSGLRAGGSETLPRGWIEIDLDKIVIYGKGKKPKTLTKKNDIGFVPYVNIKGFEKGIIDEYADVKSSKLINKTDILVVWDGARFGLTGMGMEGAAGSTLMVLTPVLNKPEYIYNFINRHYSYINSKPKGTGTPHVNPDIFWKLQFPIAPLNEQKRIAAKLDQIMPRIAAVKERLDKVPTVVKRFRQSVLTAAVTGKLTEKWRVENKVEVDWKEKKLQDMAEYQGGFAFESKKFSKEGNNQVIKIANVKEYGIDIRLAPAFIDDHYAIEAKRFRLFPGDLVISMTGTRNKRDYGFNGIVQPNTRPIFLNQRVARLRCNKSLLLPQYLSIYMKTHNFKDFFFKDETGNVNQGNVGADALKLAIFPTPPLEEQKEIVRQVDKLFALADRLESHYQKAKARVDKLSQSVLAKAFRGELVITEAELAEKEGRDFESAEKLLERILAEKAKITKPSRKKHEKN